MTKKHIIGIDPGTHTGIAHFESGKLVLLVTLTPEQIGRYLEAQAPDRVVYEDSRLQSHTWTNAPTRAAALKMARNVGEIDAWCKLLVLICERLKIPAHGISPKGKGKKITAELFSAHTGWTGSSNQHTRDAAMVAHPYRNAA